METEKYNQMPVEEVLKILKEKKAQLLFLNKQTEQLKKEQQE